MKDTAIIDEYPVWGISSDNVLPDELQDGYKANVESFDEFGSGICAAKAEMVALDQPVIAALAPQEEDS
ncbi:ferredoxin [Pseudoclavibacter sp. VKM Ac-2867]|uniref:ferredoxin n=1 Tax=Pseudoclavibacter sp. VKM Ac-2867 TaxID=2783829 RepID=UPI003A5C600B